MYLAGYNIDDGMTISTGFVVDEAIVVMEIISRHLDDGMKSLAGCLFREFAITVTMAVSLTTTPAYQDLSCESPVG